MHYQDLGFNTLVPDLSNPESESTADQSKAEIKEETSITEGESEARKMQTLDDDESITTRSGRKITAPSYLQDFELYTAYCMLTRTEEPQTYEEAIKSEDWKDAISSELDSHERLGTWTPTKLPDGQVAIDTKWIFKIKEDGTKKARLVARGFQVPFDENDKYIYAPVCRMSTLRIFLSQAANNDWVLRQVDVPTAFLNGVLQSDVYIKRPKGVKTSEETFKLNRALYGLKVAPKCWNDKFNQIMEQSGFRRSKYDCCLYCSNNVYLLLFVDDAIITGNLVEVNKLIQILFENFKVKDLGEANCFLGMQIRRNKDGVMVTQSKIIDSVLNEFNMKNCRSVVTPMEVGFQIEETDLNLSVPYRRLVCSLMYIAVTTRPDLSFAVSCLSRVLDKPTDQTWKAAKRVLRYLSNTKDLELKFEKENNSSLQCFSDADWASDKTSRKSVSGFIAFDGSNPISWFSKKQTCVALSTMEAEYCAASAAAQETVNLKGILCEFGERYNQPAIIKVDNCSAISMIKTFENSKRGKHIDIRAHFIKDLYIKKEIDVEYVSTDFNVADMLTKPLCKDKFIIHRNAALNNK